MFVRLSSGVIVSTAKITAMIPENQTHTRVIVDDPEFVRIHGPLFVAQDDLDNLITAISKSVGLL